MIKYLVLENYLKHLEPLIWGWTYDAARAKAEERSKFNALGLDRERGEERLDLLLKGLGRSFDSEERSMRSVHWVLFACLSELSPLPIRRILEIGTYDGETTFILSKLFPRSEIVTIDLPEEDPIFRQSYVRGDAQVLGEFKARQSANLAPSNIKYLTMNSFFLPGKVEGEFDLIWIDGGHLFPEVAWDICNAYSLCRTGGFIMVDDVIVHSRGFRDAYVSPDSYEVLKYVTARTTDAPTYFLKRIGPRWSAVPRRRKFVAVLKKSAGW